MKNALPRQAVKWLVHGAENRAPRSPHQRRAVPALPVSLAIALSLPVGASMAGTLIDTTRFANGFVYPFGQYDTTSYGQTFRTPGAADTRLDSFTFFLRTNVNSTRYRAYVYEWDETRGSLVGQALYTSRAGTLAQTQQFRAVTIRTGGVELAPDRNYVAFFSAAGLFDQQADEADWLKTNGNPYQSGHFVFHNSGGVFPAPSTGWDCGSNCGLWEPQGDLAFRMTFNMAAIPEASTMALMLAGLCGVGWTARARQHRSL